MKLDQKELDYLAAWAKEEKAPDPYSLPAHRLQAAHKVSGVVLIRAIKGWARAEGRKDEDILGFCCNQSPSWPWASEEQMTERLSELAEIRV